MELELYMTRDEISALLSRAVEIGVERGLENAAAAPKLISQNKAYKIFKKSRVRNWVNDGLIAGKPNGNGRTSTVYFEYAKLMELDASDRIVIRKAYVPGGIDNTLKSES
jgi:hypothetical protein